MDSRKINKMLAKIKSVSPKILVLGDVMLDHYVIGKVDKISPEAPVPILKFQKDQNILGGAGNVVKNLVNLGAEVSIATIIGMDKNGILLKKLFKQLEVSIDFLVNLKKIKTTTKTRFLSDGNHLLRLDSDTSGLLDSDFDQLGKKIHKKIKNFDCVIISDYDKGVCNPFFIKKVIKYANLNKIPIYIDPKGDSWNKYVNSDCITPNISEAEKILGIKLLDDLDFEKAAILLKNKFKLGCCLITRGPDGMTFYGNSSILHQKVGVKKVFDVSGAGDAVIASLVASLMSGFKINKSLEFCSSISSEVVTHIGTTPFHPDMIKVDK